MVVIRPSGFLVSLESIELCSAFALFPQSPPPSCSVQLRGQWAPDKPQMVCSEEITFFFDHDIKCTRSVWFWRHPFQTLTSELRRKHTWDKIQFRSFKSKHFFWFFFLFLDTFHIFGPRGLPNAHVVFCRECKIFLFTSWSLHLLFCLLKEEWSSVEEFF